MDTFHAVDVWPSSQYSSEYVVSIESYRTDWFGGFHVNFRYILRNLLKFFCYTYCVKYMPEYGFSLNLTFSYKNRIVNPVLTRKITSGHRKPAFRHILGSDWYHLGNLYSVRVWDHSLSTFTDIFEKLRFLIPPFLPCFFEENLGFSQSHVIVSCEIVNSFLQKSPLLIFVSALNT